ncbi:unnamed protein product, partial [Medioppia subpectinata]
CEDTSVADGNDRRKQLVLKVERIGHKEDNKRLENEYRFLQILATNQWYDFMIDYLTDQSFRYLLMRPLGLNLREFCAQKRKLNEWGIQTLMSFADQMISRVANCHLRGILHQDIKPENFMVDTENVLYLIDFNLAKMLFNESGAHIPYRRRSAVHSTGNVQFLSVNAHEGHQQSRRDDLISVGYTMIFLAKGSLPWSRHSSRFYSSRSEYLSAVGQLKSSCSVDELCDGLPDAFKQYMNLCLSLKFYETPNYLTLRKLFTDSLRQTSEESCDTNGAQI